MGKMLAKGLIRKIKCLQCNGKGYVLEKVTVVDKGTFEDQIRAMGGKEE